MGIHFFSKFLINSPCNKFPDFHTDFEVPKAHK